MKQSSVLPSLTLTPRLPHFKSTHIHVVFSPWDQVDRSPAISWSDVAERASGTLDYQQSTILQRVMVHKKVKGNGFSDIYIIVLEHKYKNQSCPRYEGQLIFMEEPIPHPKRPPRTPSRHSSFFAADGRAGTDSSILRHADTVAHQFDAICGRGGGVCRVPRTTTSFGPQRELPLARLVIHRQTSAHARRKGTLSVQPRSAILALFFTQQH